MVTKTSPVILPHLAPYKDALEAIDATAEAIRAHASNKGKVIPDIKRFTALVGKPLFIFDKNDSEPEAFSATDSSHAQTKFIYTQEAAEAEKLRRALPLEPALTDEQDRDYRAIKLLSKHSDSKPSPLVPYYKSDLYWKERVNAFTNNPLIKLDEFDTKMITALDNAREQIIDQVTGYTKSIGKSLIEVPTGRYNTSSVAVGLEDCEHHTLMPMMELLGRNKLLELEIEEARQNTASPELQTAKQACRDFLSTMEAVNLQGTFGTKFKDDGRLYSYDDELKTYSMAATAQASDDYILATMKGAKEFNAEILTNAIQSSCDRLVVEKVKDDYRTSDELIKKTEKQLLGSPAGLPMTYTLPNGEVINLNIADTFRTETDSKENPAPAEERKAAYTTLLDKYFHLKDKNIALQQEFTTLQNTRTQALQAQEKDLLTIIDKGKIAADSLTVQALQSDIQSITKSAGGYLEKGEADEALLARVQQEVDKLPKTLEGPAGPVIGAIRTFRGGLMKQLDEKATRLEKQIDTLAEAPTPKDLPAKEAAEREHKAIEPIDARIKDVESLYKPVAGEERRAEKDVLSASEIERQHKQMTKAGTPDADALRDKLLEAYTKPKEHPRIHTSPDSVRNL